MRIGIPKENLDGVKGTSYFLENEACQGLPVEVME